MIKIKKGNRTIIINEILAGYEKTVERNFDVLYNSVHNEDGIVDCSEPKLHKYSHDNKSYLTPSLPEESPKYTNYFKHYKPKLDNTIFDLGAYCGVNTIHMAKSVEKILSFEPDKLSRAALKFNLALHNVNNVRVFKQAISDLLGREDFNTEHCLGSALSCVSNRKSFTYVSTVETITLSEIIRLHGIPNFIKMDIEGAEFNVMNSPSIPVLAGYKIPMAIDTNHKFKDLGFTYSFVEDVLKKHNYQVETVEMNGMRTTYAF